MNKIDVTKATAILMRILEKILEVLLVLFALYFIWIISFFSNY